MQNKHTAFSPWRVLWGLLVICLMVALQAPDRLAANATGNEKGRQAGAAGTVRVGVLTDTHFDREQFPKRADLVRKALNRFNQQGVGVVLCLGDLYEGNFKGLDDYLADKAQFEPVWRGAQAPVHWVLGNHDHWGIRNEQFIQDNPYIKAINYTFDLGEQWRCVVYSNVDGRYFAATTATLSWLRTALAQAGRDGKRVIIATHARIDQDYPGAPPAWTKEPYSAFSQNADRQRAIVDDAVAKGGKIVCVLQGHHHRNAKAIRNGVTYLTFASTAEGTAAAILDFSADGGVVVR